MNPKLIARLTNIVGEGHLVTERDGMLDYLVDETPSTVRPKPADEVVLIKPGSTQEISQVVKLANASKTPIFPRGGGTGLVAGSIPVSNGIVLSLERMNKIIEVDRDNLMVVVDAGVTLQKLYEVVAKSGFSFPLHPGDEAAHIGGLVACSAGGARAVKHGIMRNYVKGLEVVLPTGEIVSMRGKLLKDVAGYDLMHLIIGSQGTLGIITRIILRLHPKPGETVTLLIPFADRYDALKTVPSILRQGVDPLAIEYVEREWMEMSAKKLGKTWAVKDGEAYLIIIITGRNREALHLTADKVDQIAKEFNAIDTLFIQNQRRQDEILDIRSKIYHALKPYTHDITDTAVPPANIVKFMESLDRIAEKFNTRLPMFGHVGDGNLHTHILMKKAGGIRKKDLNVVKQEIYNESLRLGGTITAEHGIGKIRIRNYMKHADAKTLQLVREIKKLFDPNNILNPGTILL